MGKNCEEIRQFNLLLRNQLLRVKNILLSLGCFFFECFLGRVKERIPLSSVVFKALLEVSPFLEVF